MGSYDHESGIVPKVLETMCLIIKPGDVFDSLCRLTLSDFPYYLDIFVLIGMLSFPVFF